VEQERGARRTCEGFAPAKTISNRIVTAVNNCIFSSNYSLYY